MSMKRSAGERGGGSAGSPEFTSSLGRWNPDSAPHTKRSEHNGVLIEGQAARLKHDTVTNYSTCA